MVVNRWKTVSMNWVPQILIMSPQVKLGRKLEWDNQIRKGELEDTTNKKDT